MLAGYLGTLAFIVTFFWLLFAIGAISYGLLAHKSVLVRNVSLLTFIWLGLYFAALLLVSFTSSQTIIEQTQEKCFDEMCFSVKQVNKVKTLGLPPEQKTAQGIYYVVTLQLRNAALRVPQKPDNPAYNIVDRQGKSYIYSGEGQIALERQQPQQVRPIDFLSSHRLNPGEVLTNDLVFDLPTAVEEPGIVITEGSWPTPLIIGDENSFFHLKTKIRLNL